MAIKVDIHCIFIHIRQYFADYLDHNSYVLVIANYQLMYRYRHVRIKIKYEIPSYIVLKLVINHLGLLPPWLIPTQLLP